MTMIVTNEAVAHVGDFMLLRLTSIAMWLKGVADLIVDSWKANILTIFVRYWSMSKAQRPTE